MEKNIDDIIDEVRVDNRVSQKTQKPYKVLVVKLTNNYEINLFPHPAEMSVIDALLEGAK